MGGPDHPLNALRMIAPHNDAGPPFVLGFPTGRCPARGPPLGGHVIRSLPMSTATASGRSSRTMVRAVPQLKAGLVRPVPFSRRTVTSTSFDSPVAQTSAARHTWPKESPRNRHLQRIGQRRWGDRRRDVGYHRFRTSAISAAPSASSVVDQPRCVRKNAAGYPGLSHPATVSTRVPIPIMTGADRQDLHVRHARSHQVEQGHRQRAMTTSSHR